MTDEKTPPPLAPENVYHAHLDVCRRCRERPFDLCPAGAVILAAEATKDEPWIRKGVR